jgi:hypothetical protein
MPKDPAEFAMELKDLLLDDGGNAITMPWKDFYWRGTIDRLREPRGTNIQNACTAIGIVCAYGKHVVIVCHDSNFSPAPKIPKRRVPQSVIDARAD